MEFWALTPAQFVALMEQHEAEREWDVALNARIMYAVFASGNAKKKSGKWSIKDFILQRGRKTQPEPASAEHLLAMAVHLNKALGGIDKREGVSSGNDDR